MNKDIMIGDIIITKDSTKEVVECVDGNCIYTCEGNKYNITEVIKLVHDVERKLSVRFK